MKTPHRVTALIALVLLLSCVTGTALADKERDDRYRIDPPRMDRAVAGRLADISIPAIVSTCVCEDELSSFDTLAADDLAVVVHNASGHRVPVQVSLQYTLFRHSPTTVRHETLTRDITLEPHSNTNVRFISVPSLIYKPMGINAAVHITASDIGETDRSNNSYRTDTCDSYVY
jgi:hypothetical protein